MRRIAASLASILALSLLTSCSADNAESGSRKYDVERYDLQGEFDWGESRLTASVDITLTLGEADISAIELDSKVTVREVRVAGVGPAPFAMDESGGKLVVTLPKRAAGESLTLEIDYEVETGDALRAVAARADDPISAKALFTQSEPLGAHEWMPCNDIPSDRALFSIDMRMEAAEKMIANGSLVADETTSADGHRMKYETAYPIPPYLMAFAISDFEVETTMKGDLPVSLWVRKGLPGDRAGTLNELVRLIDRFESLLVPYPFESYSLVLLPGFPVGGMENASVTFQRETSSSEPALAGDLNLMAHELAHQWFGDMVTVESWDDVWIKEGMATLLEYEGARPYLDASNKGSLNGDEFGVYDGSAIRDTTLAPENKYTSGPYDRAAWLLTQIRSLVGEDAFWGTMRSVLESRRFGTVGTDALLDAFEPSLGKEATARARLAVDARAVPTLELAPPGSTGNEGAMVTLRDPEIALVAPLEVAWLAADGTERVVKLTPNQAIELSPSNDEEILIIDPQDRHPDWYSFFADDQNYQNYRTQIRPLRVPRTASGVARFVELAGVHQRAALADHLPSVDPAMYTGFVGDLDDEGAKAISLRAACSAAVATQSSDPMLYDAWVGTLGGALPNELSLFGLSWVSNYDACAPLAAPEDLFKSDWAALESGLVGSELSVGRLVYLSKFRLTDDRALATWGSTVKNAGSLRARRTAALQLASYARGLNAASVPVWRDFFADLVSSSESSELLDQVIRGVVSTASKTPSENAKALDALSGLLHKEVTRTVHVRAVCAARTLTNGDATAWAVFAAGLNGAPLSESSAKLVKDPSSCR